MIQIKKINIFFIFVNASQVCVYLGFLSTPPSPIYISLNSFFDFFYCENFWGKKKEFGLLILVRLLQPNHSGARTHYCLTREL
jgi:hypothetical protein